MKKVLIVIIVFFLTINCYGQTRENYYKNGLEKYDQKDYAGAIIDFTKKLKILRMIQSLISKEEM